jgi:hypothetical protein
MEVVPLRGEDGKASEAALERLTEVALALTAAQEIVVGIGAGVSTASGIPVRPQPLPVL